MSYFGFTLYATDEADCTIIINYLQKTLLSVTTAETRFNYEMTQSASVFHYTIDTDGLRSDQYNFIRIYKALTKIIKHCSGKVMIEYTYPEQPADPYYALLFSKLEISLVSDARWEETNDVIILKNNYRIPKLWWKQFLIS